MKQKYKCNWCDYEFEKEVEYKPRVIGQDGRPINSQGKKSSLSTQVQCPKCARFIPTWKTERWENSTGKKHIHLR